MRVYPLHDLHSSEFEELCVLICRIILGEGITPFAIGTDGGKDGRFVGRANSYPSTANPWEGKIVIQAKHTSKINASCSDPEFQSILKKDVLPSIEKLKIDEEIDCYILFTNRKLTGIQYPKIEDLISSNTKIPNSIVGNERIQMFLKTYPNIVREAKLHELLRPLQFNEDDLKKLILEFHKTIPDIDNVGKSKLNFKYINMDRKNELNQLSKEYFEDVMKQNYNYYDTINSFLSNPINNSLKNIYKDIVDDLNAKITIKRNEYGAFERLLEDIYHQVAAHNLELQGKKRLVRVFINYMYSNCDIGKKDA